MLLVILIASASALNGCRLGVFTDNGVTTVGNFEDSLRTEAGQAMCLASSTFSSTVSGATSASYGFIIQGNTYDVSTVDFGYIPVSETGCSNFALLIGPYSSPAPYGIQQYDTPSGVIPSGFKPAIRLQCKSSRQPLEFCSPLVGKNSASACPFISSWLDLCWIQTSGTLPTTIVPTSTIAVTTPTTAPPTTVAPPPTTTRVPTTVAPPTTTVSAAPPTTTAPQTTTGAPTPTTTALTPTTTLRPTTTVATAPQTIAPQTTLRPTTTSTFTATTVRPSASSPTTQSSRQTTFQVTTPTLLTTVPSTATVTNLAVLCIFAALLLSIY